MKKVLKKFETAMTAVAFAEAGEFETARQILREKPETRQRKKEQKQPRMTARAGRK